MFRYLRTNVQLYKKNVWKLLSLKYYYINFVDNYLIIIKSTIFNAH